MCVCVLRCVVEEVEVRCVVEETEVRCVVEEVEVGWSRSQRRLPVTVPC